MLNIVVNENLINVPILIIFETGKEELSFTPENLRLKIIELNKENINFQFISFDRNAEEILFGLDWLIDNMKALN